jgi:hypothetical protein
MYNYLLVPTAFAAFGRVCKARWHDMTPVILTPASRRRRQVKAIVLLINSSPALICRTDVHGPRDTAHATRIPASCTSDAMHLLRIELHPALPPHFSLVLRPHETSMLTLVPPAAKRCARDARDFARCAFGMPIPDMRTGLLGPSACVADVAMAPWRRVSVPSSLVMAFRAGRRAYGTYRWRRRRPSRMYPATIRSDETSDWSLASHPRSGRSTLRIAYLHPIPHTSSTWTLLTSSSRSSTTASRRSSASMHPRIAPCPVWTSHMTVQTSLRGRPWPRQRSSRRRRSN